MTQQFLRRHAARKFVFTLLFFLPLFGCDAAAVHPVFFGALTLACLFLCRSLWRAICRDRRAMRRKTCGYIATGAALFPLSAAPAAPVSAHGGRSAA